MEKSKVNRESNMDMQTLRKEVKALKEQITVLLVNSKQEVRHTKGHPQSKATLSPEPA